MTTPSLPQQFARRLVGSEIEAAEHVHIDDDEEHRRAVHVDVAQQPAVIHVAHDALDRIEGMVDMRRVLHAPGKCPTAIITTSMKPASAAEIPPVAEVLRGRIFVRFVMREA